MLDGEIRKMPDWKYHGNDTHLSSSQLKYALKDMNRFNAYVNEGMSRFDTPALAFGRAAHTFILEQDEFVKNYAIFDDSMDMRLKASKELKKEFDAEAKKNKKEVIKKSDFSRIQYMFMNIANYPNAGKLLGGGEAEVSYFFRQKEFGLDLKVRPDYINHEEKYIVDLKTSRDASHAAFSRDFKWNFNYDLSAAMYLDGLKHCTGEDYDYYFVVVEKEEPHSVAAYKLGEESYQLGRNKYRKAMEKIVQSTETGLYQLQTRIEEI